MNCDICHRAYHARKLPFLCAVDARNQLYECRVENIRALMANEEMERQVNAVLSSPSSPPSSSSSAAATTPSASSGALRAQQVSGWQSEQASLADRTAQITAQAERLRAEVDAARAEIASKREHLARRRSDLVSVAGSVEARRARQLDETEKSVQRLRFKWNRSADTMASTRAFLCEEAARLYGLRQVKKGGSHSRRYYEIGGVEIAELHEMNKVSPEVISTCLAHVAHILVLASHYLAVRLPAEITLPHRDYPRPTIFNLAASYKHGEVSFPASQPVAGAGVGGGGAGTSSAAGGSGGGSSGGAAAAAATSTRDGVESERTPHPRPLFIDKPLPVMAKDDPLTYSYFLEGVTLLAYDIAWLCCSQGVSFGDKNSYEDICNMGQNLWRLLIGEQVYRKSVEPVFPPHSSSPHAGGSGGFRNNSNNDDHDAAMAAAELAKPKSQIGHWSHGTTHTFLGGADGTEFVQNFKLLNPTKIHDRLKKRLSSEAPMLEWENIDGDEVEDDLGEGLMSIPAFGERTASTRTNGWTRLKSR